MEVACRRGATKVSGKTTFKFLNKIQKIQEIDVYDNDKRLILVGRDSTGAVNHIIDFDRQSIELRLNVDQEVSSEEEVKEYLKKSKCKKSFKYKANAVFGIYNFYKLTYICLIKKAEKVADFVNEPIYEIKEVEFFAIQAKKFYKKQLSKKDVDKERTYKKSFRSYKMSKFYFCYGYDLSTNIQKQRRNIQLCQDDFFSKKFTWNGDLKLFKSTFQFHEWLVPIIHGYVGTFKIDIIDGFYTLISRRSRFSTGARYLKRGLNKLGHCANEVESEHILAPNDPMESSYIKISSFVQIRASIPLVWRNKNLKSVKPKFEYKEENNKDYLASFYHLNELQERYEAESICFFNLIRQHEGKGNESTVGKAFREFCTVAFAAKDKVIKAEDDRESFSVVEMDEGKTPTGDEEGELENSPGKSLFCLPINQIFVRDQAITNCLEARVSSESSEEEKEEGEKSDIRVSLDDYEIMLGNSPHDFGEVIKKERTMTFSNALETALQVSNVSFL